MSYTMQHTRETTALFRVPVPWLLAVCFDCTLSIPREQFPVAKRELCNFLFNVHRRARLLPRQPSDFLSVVAFEDQRKVYGPRPPLQVVKMDQASHVGALCDWVSNLKREGRRTALYDAVRVGSGIVDQLDRRLPHRYLKVVVAITDGEDNDSRTRLEELGFFARKSSNLAVIGVGGASNGAIRELGPYATSTHEIGDFGGLYRALTITMTRVVQHRRTVRW